MRGYVKGRRVHAVVMRGVAENSLARPPYRDRLVKLRRYQFQPINPAARQLHDDIGNMAPAHGPSAISLIAR